MSYSTKTILLHQPPLEEVAKVLQKGLLKNFTKASVKVVDSPDLSQHPYGLASPGLCGSPCIGEVGGVPNLMPLVNKEKIYDLQQIAKDIGIPKALLLGAGAGPFPRIGINSELALNASTSDQGVRNMSTITKNLNEKYVTEALPHEENRCAILLNFFGSEGLPGKIVEVSAEYRTGDEDFVGCMRKALEDEYEEKVVGFGGVFLLKEGAAKIHVMSDFSCTPLLTLEDIDNWLNFYEMSAPMSFVSVFLSRDPGIDIRLEHSHGHGMAFGKDTGGHYHYDVTPEQVQYKGYFCMAEKVHRLDQCKDKFVPQEAK